MTPQARRRALGLVAAGLIALALAIVLLLPPPGQGTATGPVPLDYVGVRSCQGCHPEEVESWRGSHHDLAIQRPDAKTVLGDFASRSFVHQGATTRFFQRNGDYLVRTGGPDGRAADFKVAYVFGVTPLEQYLLEQPGGGCRRSASGGTAGRRATEASASSTSTPARRSTTPTSCTGRDPRRTGTASARSATRPTCARATWPRRTASKPPSRS